MTILSILKDLPRRIWRRKRLIVFIGMTALFVYWTPILLARATSKPLYGYYQGCHYLILDPEYSVERIPLEQVRNPWRTWLPRYLPE